MHLQKTVSGYVLLKEQKLDSQFVQKVCYAFWLKEIVCEGVASGRVEKFAPVE